MALGSPGTWGHGSLEHAGCRLGSGVAAEARRTAGLSPARGELQRPSAPARRPHLSRLSPLSPASCQRAAGAGAPERGCRRGEGRCWGWWPPSGGGGRVERGRPRPRPRPVRGSSVPAASLLRPVRSRRRGGGAAHEVKMVIRVFVASSSGSVAVSGGERRGEGRGAGRGPAAARAQPAGPGTARGEAARRLSAAARRPRGCRACPRLRDLAPHAGMDLRVSGLLRNVGLNLTGLPMQRGGRMATTSPARVVASRPPPPPSPPPPPAPKDCESLTCS